MDQLAADGRPVGVYSTFRDWTIVTDGWAAPSITANWVAGRSRSGACSERGFSGAPVWLAQETATWPEPSGYDSDWSC
jgi:hypothetical protein